MTLIHQQIEIHTYVPAYTHTPLTLALPLKGPKTTAPMSLYMATTYSLRK